MSVSLQSNSNINQMFFEEVFKGNIRQNKVELRALNKNQQPITKFVTLSGDFYSEISKFTEDNNNEYGIYYGVSTRRTDINGKKENCASCSALFIDIDTGQTGHKKESVFKTKNEAFGYIKRLDLGQSVIIDSGHGLHLYWLLNEPYLFDQDNIADFESTLKKLSSVYRADPTHDISRVFRVPGSKNIKDTQTRDCKIFQSDYKKRYAFADLKNLIESNPLFQTRISEIKSSDLVRNIFGFFDVAFASRSEADQSIICRLLKLKFSEEDITAIFNCFPTSGKYLESKQMNSSAAGSYLLHSIKKAMNYLQHPTTNEGNVKRTVIKSNDEKLESITNELENDTYYASYDEDYFGYWKTMKSGEQLKLSNFIIKYNKQIKMKIDNTPLMMFEGTVFFTNNVNVNFDNMPATILSSTQKLKEYLLNLCGIKVQFYANGSALCEAIKYCNKNILEEIAMEFGFDESKNNYITPDFIASASGISLKKTPILFSENWKGNKVGFKPEIEPAFESLLYDTIDKFFTWDDPKVTLIGLSFTLLPIIYPFISGAAIGKPYVMLLGTTGCGKTTMARWLQHFYGDYNNLASWTSTSTSLNIIGSAYKDALIVLDDFKKANFYNENDIRKAMTLLQNYSDGHARSRANVELKVRDDKPFKGFLLLSAEDIVISQPSTLARGVVVPVNKKTVNHKLLNEIDALSKSFSHITLKYLQFILSIEDKEAISAALLRNKEELYEYVQKNNIEGDNIPRIINNFAILKTSWQNIYGFLKLSCNHQQLDNYNEVAQLSFLSLFKENFERTSSLNPEELYENALWEMIANELLVIEDVRSKVISYAPADKIIGFYKSEPGQPFQMILKYHESFRRIECYLREQGGLGISEPTLKAKLVQLGKIKYPEGGRVQLGEKQIRGVYWTGDVPFEIIGKPTLRSFVSDDEKLPDVDTTTLKKG